MIESINVDSSLFYVLGFYFLMSAITYILYFRDKRASVKGKWRTKESTLHLCSLMGGWMGAMYAQKQFHHKTRKQPFKTIFYLTVLLHISFNIWLLSQL